MAAMPFKFLARERAAPIQPIGEIIRENIFAPFRERILYPAAAAGAVVFLPLALHHIHQQDYFLAGALLLLVAMLAIDAVAIGRNGPPPIPFALLLVPAGGAVGIALATHGLYGALWTFPMVMFCYFVLRRRVANMVALGMLLLGVTMLVLYHDSGVALRFFIALGLCVVTINVLLEVLESLQARLIEQSVVDTSTGAFNRRHMDTCLQHVLERHRRNGATASLLILDIDRFGKVNDRFGVEGGDRVLRAFVGQVKERVRAADMLFRCGGEKFAVLLPDAKEEEAAMLAELLRRDVAHTPVATGHALTVSIGVSELREGDVPEAWVKRSDKALREAKDEGRNRVMVAGKAQENITAGGIQVAA
jgi:diguanylate cyclase (GGDEF)-like protein